MAVDSCVVVGMDVALAVADLLRVIVPVAVLTDVPEVDAEAVTVAMMVNVGTALALVVGSGV